MFATLVATLVRAAVCTISTWEENMDLLLQSDCRTLGMYSQEELSPAFWDSPPIAATLRDAANGFPEHPLLGKVLPGIVARAKRRLAAQTPAERFKFQRFVADELKTALYPDSIPLLLKRRFNVLQPGVSFDDVDIDALRDFLRKLSPAWATSILKTWEHAWTTTYRMHEPLLRTCVFGCSGERDELYHYIRCVRLHEFLEPASRDPVPTAAEVLLLSTPTTERAVLLVDRFLVYHAVKNSLGPPPLPDNQIRRLVAAAQGQARQGMSIGIISNR
jgi:hypothetical protein